MSLISMSTLIVDRCRAILADGASGIRSTGPLREIEIPGDFR